ncbi:GAF domain-containing protein [Streptomyces huasconensis]|nr:MULTISPECIES: GAF domain-containing protein [Streptomyces]UFQ20165.1 GAF domain-containing protein [Streptomyces huasconensis]WCL89783.1 GAF domain-containing protein [Streptomyces sp. JCM 35825]
MPDGADVPLPPMPLLEAVLSVGTDLELRATLQHIVDSAARLTGAEHGTLGAGAGAGGAGGAPETFVAGGPGRGPVEEPGGDVIRVPIPDQDEVFGDLVLAKKTGAFTAEDRQLLTVLASQAGIAIGNARLFEAARQRERWIEGAAAVTTALLTGEAAADALMTVADRARTLAGAAAGVILQPTEAGGMRIVAAATDGAPHGWGASAGDRTRPADLTPSATATPPPGEEARSERKHRPKKPTPDRPSRADAPPPNEPAHAEQPPPNEPAHAEQPPPGEPDRAEQPPPNEPAHAEQPPPNEPAHAEHTPLNEPAHAEQPPPNEHDRPEEPSPNERAHAEQPPPGEPAHAEQPPPNEPTPAEHSPAQDTTPTPAGTPPPTPSRPPLPPPPGYNDLIGTTIEPGSAVLAQLLGGEPVFIEDSATDPRMTTHVRLRFGPSMMLPLQAGGRLIGTLALPRRRGAPAYTAAERLLATQFASQAALALVLADAQQSRERLAVFEDRDRIARDLHDLVVQRLFATGMMLESTRRKAGSPKVEATLDQAVDELESTIQEVRTAIFALQQPPADAPTTFRGKVLRETAGAAAILGVQPSVHFGGAVDTRIADPAASHLLAALRRALAAVSRRTGVTRVDVAVDARATLPDGRDGVRLTVYDDGDTDGVKAGTTVTWQAPL